MPRVKIVGVLILRSNTLTYGEDRRRAEQYGSRSQPCGERQYDLSHVPGGLERCICTGESQNE